MEGEMYMKLKKWQVIGLVVLGIGVIGAFAGGGDDTTTSESTPQEEKIEYKEVSLNKMSDELEDNALKAKKTYDNQYIEVTGYLSNIDSSGDYISLKRTDDKLSLYNIQCFVKDDKQLDIISEFKINDKVTVKGQVTDVGEIMGYTLDISEVGKAK